jgi:hypothetical protein
LGEDAVTDHQPFFDERDVPEPPDLAERRRLFEEYERRFGEKVPLMMIKFDEVQEIREALRTGQPIDSDLPPGYTI